MRFLRPSRRLLARAPHICASRACISHGFLARSALALRTASDGVRPTHARSRAIRHLPVAIEAGRRMAHALIARLDQLVEDGSINEGVYKELAELVKEAKDKRRDALVDKTEVEILAPLLHAEVGDTFSHHAYEGDRGGRWLSEDMFTFLGRADGSTNTPKGWWLFRIVDGDTRGICQAGSNEYAGTNGGMLDAIGAWPLANYRNYASDGTFDDRELALPTEMCWGFRLVDEENNDESEDDDEQDQEDDEQDQEDDEHQGQDDGEPETRSPALKRAREE